jgi:short-subunit dehydrogenase
MFDKYSRKRVFITGAGSGLGLAFAIEFAKSGWTIGITDIREERLDQAATAIQAAGGKVSKYVFDVNDYDKFGLAVADFISKYGGIDIGINNAGIGCGGIMQDTPIETFRRVIDINLMGVVNGCYLFVPTMQIQKSGHILNVASAAAFVSAPRMSAYNASKAAVLSLSETLCAELLEENIHVSVLMPTYVRTNIGNDAVGTAEGKKHAQLLVGESNLTPEMVVKETLLHMERKKLYIILPGNAQFLWRFKRLMPDRFRHFIHGEVKRRISEFESENNRLI